MNAADMAKVADQRSTLLFVGGSGDGKTCAGYSFPKKLLHFDLDKRWKGVLGHPIIGNDSELLKEVEIKQYDLAKWLELGKDMDVLKIQCLKPQDFPCKTFLYDGCSTHSDLAISYALKLNGGGKKVAGKGLAGWDEFGYEIQDFKDTALFLKMLPCNVIATAHWVDDYDDKGKRVGKRINLRDKVWGSICKYFDEVYHFERVKTDEGVRYVCNFRSELARTSFLKLPDSIDWTGKNFYELWLSLLKGQ